MTPSPTGRLWLRERGTALCAREERGEQVRDTVLVRACGKGGCRGCRRIWRSSFGAVWLVEDGYPQRIVTQKSVNIDIHPHDRWVVREVRYCLA